MLRCCDRVCGLWPAKFFHGTARLMRKEFDAKPSLQPAQLHHDPFDSVAQKRPGTAQSEKPLRRLDPRRKEIPNHLMPSLACNTILYCTVHAAEKSQVEFYPFKSRRRACRPGPTLVRSAAPCCYPAFCSTSFSFDKPPTPFHLKQRMSRHIRGPTAVKQARSAVHLPSSDACCAESCNVAE
ncbi:hypothetical protein N431DRAFT_131421 [Stipitochalara longipes BDJ]|nr:hypothetical protein N431DRAFT_131421 [Stipitochalara longipes BDJ]